MSELGEPVPLPHAEEGSGAAHHGTSQKQGGDDAEGQLGDEAHAMGWQVDGEMTMGPGATKRRMRFHEGLPQSSEEM